MNEFISHLLKQVLGSRLRFCIFLN